MMNSLLATVLAFLISVHQIQNVFGIQRSDPLVNTQLGQIRGLRANDGNYSMFLGIPYAIVDENNVFGPSIPYGSFDEVFEAYDDTAICPQIEEFNNTITGTLDCLHLNIYVPDSADTQNPVPVLVWIYGGGYIIGFHGRYLYGPKFLVRHDVILVTLNYRLGPYGFMCLDTPEIPGNQGFKDQLLALRWIKNNINAFGGDIEKITLFGESAGGISVDLHLLSEQENLFNNVIMQSGTSLLPAISPRESDVNYPIRLASQLSFETDDVNEALAFLSSQEPSHIISAASLMNRPLPCVEKEFDGIERFITALPIHQDIPKVRNMAVLAGFTNDENLLNVYNKGPEFYETYDGFNMMLNFGFDFNITHLAEMEQIVRQFYIGDEKPSAELMRPLIDMDSDFNFNHPTIRSIKKFVENGADRVYHYVFSYVGGRNFVRQMHPYNVTYGGAVHADEIGYLFDISYMTESSEDDYLIVDRMTTMWANFAKYSDPVPETNDILPIKWTPITNGSNFHYLDINLEMKLSSRPFHDRTAFWDLFYVANKHYQKGYMNNNDTENNNGMRFETNCLLLVGVILISLVSFSRYMF